MDITTYTEDQLDCLQEICNVAMGRAGAELAKQYDVFIRLSIPIIKILNATELSTSLDGYRANDKVYAAGQLFDAEHKYSDLSGVAMVVLSETSFAELKGLLLEPMSDEDLLRECCRVMSQTCLDALSEDWGLGFQVQPPQQISSDNLDHVCDSLSEGWEQVLMVEINYQMEGNDYSGDLILLFPNQAIDAMAVRLDELLA